MCGPAIPIALTVASAAMQAYAQHQAGQAANSAAKFNAKQDEYNATLADARSKDALTRGTIEAGQIREDAAKEVGAGRTSFAAGNVDLSSGSVAYWEADTIHAGAQDAATRQYNARQEAMGIQGESWNARSSARLSRAQGTSAARAGNINAGASLLAGAAETAYRFRN